MLTGSKFRINTSSPIQAKSPMDNFQGKMNIYTRFDDDPPANPRAERSKQTAF